MIYQLLLLLLIFFLLEPASKNWVLTFCRLVSLSNNFFGVGLFGTVEWRIQDCEGGVVLWAGWAT